MLLALGGKVSWKKKKTMFKSIILAGSAKQYQLVWDGDNNLSEWVPEDQIIDLDTAEVPTSKEARTCNTRKDRDKRKNRHTCGIFIG